MSFHRDGLPAMMAPGGSPIESSAALLRRLVDAMGDPVMVDTDNDSYSGCNLDRHGDARPIQRRRSLLQTVSGLPDY